MISNNHAPFAETEKTFPEWFFFILKCLCSITMIAALIVYAGTLAVAMVMDKPLPIVQENTPAMLAGQVILAGGMGLVLTGIIESLTMAKTVTPVQLLHSVAATFALTFILVVRMYAPDHLSLDTFSRVDIIRGLDAQIEVSGNPERTKHLCALREDFRQNSEIILSMQPAPPACGK